MSRLWYGSAFVLIAAVALYGMHHYVWARWVRDVRPSRRLKLAGTLAVFVLAALVIAAFAFGRRGIGEARYWLALSGYTWLGVLFYAVLVLGALDLVRMLLHRSRRTRSRAVELESPSRRRFLARSVAGSAAFGAGGIALTGVRGATGEILTPEIPVALERLPSALSGFRIAHLSDLHMGPLLHERFLSTVVERTNALRPDLVVITGDMVDASVEALGRELAPLAKLQARCGVAFVTGNHEYYSGAEEWIAFLRSRGIRVLQNERVAIGDRTLGGATFDLAGVPDAHAVSHPSGGPDLARVLVGRDPERELVFLAHQPVQIASAEGLGVGLQLSGHTHGGQMWPFGLLVGLVQPYVAGLHRHHDGTQIYVSRGTGFWGPPMRVGNPAEIASIVLHR
ncbi:MAG: metallophosphoesterase [Planctomycetota bacterium]